METPRIAVLGASGLIGFEVARHLRAEGFPVRAIARRFPPGQAAALGGAAETSPIVDLDAAVLARLLGTAEIVVNCIGVLQDSPVRGTTQGVNRGFVDRLLDAMAATGHRGLLVHLSVPGREPDDPTDFSRSKRAAERAVAAARLSFVILRPGFVIAPAAYGGSALVRALAALPVALPEREASRSFAGTDIGAVARTIAIVAGRWARGERAWHAVWDVMERDPSTVGGVIEGFRRHFGGPAPRATLPSWLLDAGAWAGDLAGHLGWSPPIRSTALAEMRRGVDGDPGPWMEATGIDPAPLAETLAQLPATVQERWFARLYLVKPLLLGTLVVFWVASGLIALTVAFDAATAILTTHGFPVGLARVITVASSLADILIGAAIAVRRSCRTGLLAGIGLSLAYMAGAALLTPDLWTEPLGALVKTGPAIVLMLVALAVLDER